VAAWVEWTIDRAHSSLKTQKGPNRSGLSKIQGASGAWLATKKRTMYTDILIPTDGSELAGKAVEHGIALAKWIGAKTTVLTVLSPFRIFTTDTQMIEDTPAQYQARTQKHAEKILAAVAHSVRAAGVACDIIQVEHEHPYWAIIDTAGSKGCDLIVMASHGRRGISAIVLGSETVKVLTHSKIPVLVHR
jgi:nucleotide-binding universal stress UspA family protein